MRWSKLAAPAAMTVMLCVGPVLWAQEPFDEPQREEPRREAAADAADPPEITEEMLHAAFRRAIRYLEQHPESRHPSGITEAAMRALQTAKHPLQQRLAALEKNDPEMFRLVKEDQELDHQSQRLAEEYRKTTGEQREEIRGRITETVERHFEVRQQRRELELARLEEKIDRLREAIERRNEARELLVRKRVSKLLGEKDELDF